MIGIVIVASIIIVAVIVAIVLIAKSLHFLDMDERGIKKRLGVPGDMVGPGGYYWIFCWPNSGIDKRPMTLFDLPYKEIKVLTKGGKFLEGTYGSVMVTFIVISYLTFPDDKDGLIKAIQAGVSQTKIGLIDITQESVKTAVTAEASQMTWPEIFISLVALAEKSEIYLQNKSPLLKAGFTEKDIQLGIEQATLPRALEDELANREVTSISVEVGRFRAQIAAFDLIGPVLYSMAETKGITIDMLQDEIKASDAMQEELRQYALEVNRELEKARLGAFFQFKVDGEGDGLGKLIMEIFALVKGLSSAGEKRTTVKTGSSGRGSGSSGNSNRGQDLRARARRT